jgi:GxxExxY protein
MALIMRDVSSSRRTRGKHHLIGGRDPEMQQGEPEEQRSDVTGRIIAACIEVHRRLGPGLLESAYERCLCHELSLSGLFFERQRVIPLEYKGVTLDCGYRVDILVQGSVVVEIKAVEQILPVHQAQVITYLKLMGLRTGLLVNFHVANPDHSDSASLVLPVDSPGLPKRAG